MAKDWNVWIDLNSFGWNVLKAEFMEQAVAEAAEKIRRKCGDGYAVTIVKGQPGQRRITANVYPETRKAYRDNMDNNTLLKARG
ncbi:hypothetical protein IJI17_02775 [Candidatus Saccharibacteria bacterium]|nr:hypothetical protein [Fibrobacter sp.]MBQ6321114.1 hypothetical protein [Candidatus Saccharibacteria bacterium]